MPLSNLLSLWMSRTRHFCRMHDYWRRRTVWESNGLTFSVTGRSFCCCCTDAPAHRQLLVISVHRAESQSHKCDAEKNRALILLDLHHRGLHPNPEEMGKWSFPALFNGLALGLLVWGDHKALTYWGLFCSGASRYQQAESTTACFKAITTHSQPSVSLPATTDS